MGFMHSNRILYILERRNGYGLSINQSDFRTI